MELHAIKKKLARIFDDNLETVQWKNYFDYAIMGFILLSTLEVFLSTYDGMVERYGIVLRFIDVLTTIVFTIEVSLRIWCADLLDERYKGVVGHLRYCFSFYGLIDILSTYTFYLALFVPANYSLFKSLRLVRILRIFRLLRIFRYMRSIRILGKAVQKCRTEMVVSLQFLCVVTVLLSFVLYFVEHEAQPDVYDNGWTSVLWSFMQYIRDPGGFADTPPITLCGRIIASIIGVLGIAIFAVPAGLIGSAFTDVMADEDHEEELEEWKEKLHLAFERKLDRPTGFQIAPKYVSIIELQARLNLKSDEIIEAVQNDEHFRLINLACTQPAEQYPQDCLAVEHFSLNTPYGQCIDRGSKVTIFTPSNIVDPVMGWWGYYLAKIGGFNYVARELGTTRPYKSFYTYKPENLHEHQQEFMDDMNRMCDSQDKWVINVMAASGAAEPEYPTQVHFGYGGKKGDGTYDDPNIMLNDVPLFEAFYNDAKTMLKEQYGLESDKQLYHNNYNSAHYYRHLNVKPNVINLRVAWAVTCWDMRAIALARDLALLIRRYIEPERNDHPLCAELKAKDIAYDGYTD